MTKDQEALVITMEECGELAQACSKLVRFGTDADLTSKLKMLNDEAGDVLALLDILKDMGYLCEDRLAERIVYKKEKLKQYSNLFN